MSGLGFDIVLAIALIVFSIWESTVAFKEKSKKRMFLVIGSLVFAGILLYMRAPAWIPWLTGGS